MKAAIYARKSTDDNDKNPENKSVTRQVERARAYAEAKRWTVDEAHVYVDDDVSGAKFGKHRPGLLRLLNHMNEFVVVVMSELSRLGCGFNRSTQQIDEIVQLVFHNLVSSLDVR